MACDMCGSSGQMFKAEVEGTIMTLCENCSKFGKVTHRYKTNQEMKHERKVKQVEQAKINVRKETIFLIVDDCAQRVKRAREKMGLKQEEVAKKVALKESLLHNIESGFEPTIKTARILEKFFGIILVEQHEEELTGQTSSKGGSMTLGDMIKARKS